MRLFVPVDHVACAADRKHAPVRKRHVTGAKQPISEDRLVGVIRVGFDILGCSVHRRAERITHAARDVAHFAEVRQRQVADSFELGSE